MVDFTVADHGEALAEVRESLAQIGAIAALRLIEAQAACAARRLEQLEREAER